MTKSTNWSWSQTVPDFAAMKIADWTNINAFKGTQTGAIKHGNKTIQGPQYKFYKRGIQTYVLCRPLEA